MKIAVLTFLFVVSITAPAFARLGESGDEIVARYGQPLSQIDQKAEGAKLALTFLTFQKSGFEVDVTLSGGTSVSESFRKINGEALTIAEVRTLLNSNTQGFGWEAPLVVEDQKKWTRDDGAVATLTGGRILNLASKELLAEKSEAKKLEHQPSLEGF
jgi:hypothetical protein